MIGNPDYGGEHERTSILCDGVTLVNAVELLEVGDATQVIVCGCGVVQCASGGWVRFRRFGDDVVWIPHARRSEPHFGPPDYFHEHGAPRITGQTWRTLRECLPVLPEACALVPLRANELIGLLQDCAPNDVLGCSPDEPRLRRDRLLNVMSGTLSEECDAIDRCLERYASSSAPVAPGRAGERMAMVELLLDTPDAELWSAFGRVGGELFVVVDGAPMRIEEDGGSLG